MKTNVNLYECNQPQPQWQSVECTKHESELKGPCAPLIYVCIPREFLSRQKTLLSGIWGCSDFKCFHIIYSGTCAAIRGNDVKWTLFYLNLSILFFFTGFMKDLTKRGFMIYIPGGFPEYWTLSSENLCQIESCDRIIDHSYIRNHLVLSLPPHSCHMRMTNS